MQRKTVLFTGLFFLSILIGRIVSYSPAGNPVVLEQGEAKTFTVAVSPVPAQYAWYVDGVLVPGAVSNTFSYVLSEGHPSLHTVEVKAGSDSRLWNVNYAGEQDPWRISLGVFHTVAIKNNGSLWSWGSNMYGARGNGKSTGSSPDPARLGTRTDWDQVITGGADTLAIRTDGSLWAWGYNGYGQLGDGTTVSRTAPTRIGTDTNWGKLIGCTYHTLAFKSDGSLWGWGFNSYGQLGDGTITSKLVPTRISADADWGQAALGYFHTVALKSGGSLWACGRNQYGQLGDGTNADKVVFTRIGTDTDWVQVTAGVDHTLALKGNGSLWAWGDNQLGQLGDGTKVTRTVPAQVGADTDWVQAAAGSYHTLAIKADGSLWAWGSNIHGECGDGTGGVNKEKTVPARIGTGTDWVKVMARGTSSMAVKADGSIWAWGNNQSGQLGDGTSVNKLVPTRVNFSL